jgi:hypothetical protein
MWKVRRPTCAQSTGVCAACSGRCDGSDIPRLRGDDVLRERSLPPGRVRVEASANNRCWASDDEHVPRIDGGRVEVTTLLHVSKEFANANCRLEVQWRGSESGALHSFAASMTDESDARIAHWRVRFPLPRADAAIRVEQKVVCPGGITFPLYDHALAADNAGHRVCETRPKPAPVSIDAGANEVVLEAQPGILLRQRATEWVDLCSQRDIVDTASLPGALQSFVPQIDVVGLTEGEQLLAVRSTGLTDPVDPVELPSGVLHFDHDLSPTEARALTAALASAAWALVIHGEYVHPHPR